MEIGLTVREEGPRAVLTAECPDDGRGLYKAYLRSGRSRYLLGTLMPEGKKLRVRRIVSIDELRRQGVWPATHAEAELAFSFQGGGAPAGWTWTQGPGELFQDPALSRAAGELGRVLVKKGEGSFMLACPYETDKEYPFTEIFCVSRLRRIEGRLYALFSFDERGWPVVQNV